MEILLDRQDSTKYYDEVLAVVSNYKKLVKNPRKKIRGLTSSAISLTLIAVVFMIVFTVLYLRDTAYSLYLYIDILFIAAVILGVIYYALIKRRISKFKEVDSSKKFVIEDDHVEMHIGDEVFPLKFSDMHWIILNRYSITFLPKTEGARLIAIDIKYKSQVISNISEKSLIIDNSDLY